MGSSPYGPGAIEGRRRFATWTGLMCTTAGRTCSATLTNADCSASAAFGVCAGAGGADGTRLKNRAWIQKPAPRKAKSAQAARAMRTLLGTIRNASGLRSPPSPYSVADRTRRFYLVSRKLLQSISNFLDLNISEKRQ